MDNNNNNNLFTFVRFGDDVNNYVFCIVSKTDVDRIQGITTRTVMNVNNIIIISGNLPEDNNDPDFVVIGSNAPGDGGGDEGRIKIMVLPQSYSAVELKLSQEVLQLARKLLDKEDKSTVKDEDIKSNIDQLIISLRYNLNNEGGRRRSSTTRKSSSSRRRRASSRSTKKRGTLRKQKRRQRRAH